jgi:hypothetical protein
MFIERRAECIRSGGAEYFSLNEIFGSSGAGTPRNCDAINMWPLCRQEENNTELPHYHAASQPDISPPIPYNHP